MTCLVTLIESRVMRVWTLCSDVVPLPPTRITVLVMRWLVLVWVPS